MTDDLQARLRVLAGILGNGDQDLNIWGEQVAEAADRIDALKAELALAEAFHSEAVAERNLAWYQLDKLWGSDD